MIWYKNLPVKKGLRNILVFTALTVVSFMSIPAGPAVVSAQFSVDDLNSVLNSSPNYDPNADCDVSSSTTNATANTGTGAANGYPIRLPVIKDPQKLATAIDQYIAKSSPKSPMNGMGKYFVQGGMRAGINPLLAVAQARHESGFGTAGVATNGSNNAFGRRSSATQPNVNMWYKWPSWEKSLYADAFPASGKVDQPDDWFQYVARRYADKLDNFDAFVNAYAPAFENDTPRYMATVIQFTFEIASMSGGAIDLTQLGSSSSAPTTTTASVPAPSAATTGPQTVVAIDPGHGGAVPEYTDPLTGLGDRETTNSPEREDVQSVANLVQAALEKAGYKVVMLKTNATDSVSKRQRIDAAKAAHANIGISIHTDYGMGSFEKWGEVWPQFIGGFRQSASNPNVKVEFSNNDTANASNYFSDVITQERDKAERGGSGVTKKVQDQSSSFKQSRGLPSWGNLSLMQLWADDIPWVYNEAGSSPSGLTPTQKYEYASGLVNGIEKAIPANGSGLGTGTQSTCGGGGSTGTTPGNGNIVATALLYAWPVYRKAGSSGATTPKPEYKTAIDAALKGGQYVGGNSKLPGIDCGGFVTRAMIDSGYEPNYNHAGSVKQGAGPTGTQLAWVRANWQLIGRGNKISTADLRPGDVALKVTSSGSNGGHTFMYVGDQSASGFTEVIASASLLDRAPMAGKDSAVASNIEWYRKK